jgi:two-component system, OmpR family, response regulator
MTRLLIAEDDINLGALLAENLRMAGYATELATDGHEAKQLFAQQSFDLCVLDVMLPRKDGFQLALEVREKDPSAAFIFLTAKNTLMDKRAGFKAGCDDYMTKPFEMDELLLRINAILERTSGPRLHMDPLVHFGRSTLNLREHTLLIGTERVELTDKEVRLVHVLALHLGRTVTRAELLTRVWGKDDPYHSKSMDVYLTRIRKYLRLDGSVVLQNVHGHGYRLIET